MGDDFSAIVTVNRNHHWVLRRSPDATDIGRPALQVNGVIQSLSLLSRQVVARGTQSVESLVEKKVQSTRELLEGDDGDLCLVVATDTPPPTSLGERQAFIHVTVDLAQAPSTMEDIVWESSIQVAWFTYGSGPTFAGPREAVEFYQRLGFEFIFVDLADGRYWAGPRASLTPWDSLPVFDPLSPETEADRARRNVVLKQEEWRAHEAEARSRAGAESGAALRDRRERLGLSIDAVAERSGFSREWLLALESGSPSASDTPMSAWIDLVWATTEPWPDAKRHALERWGNRFPRFGWVGAGLGVAEHIVARLVAGPEMEP